jgi:aspartate aminotransferase
MTGWRLGWSIAEKELTQKMAALQSQSTSHVTSFVQMAAIAAAKLPPSYIENLVSAFERRRNYCIQRLSKLSDHMTYVKPTGAFYFFLNCASWLNRNKMTDTELCKELLEKAQVGVVPGSFFGKDKFIRISYATSDENLAKAFDRIEKFLNK